MTLAALILAVAATVVGSLFTLFTTSRLTRETGRTAARLLYAELTRNSAAVSYYLRTGTWPQAKFDTPVWNQRSEAIAKMRQAEAFSCIYKGYAALEAVAFIAQEGGQLGDSRELILTEVERLRAAIRKAGDIAQLDRDELQRGLVGLVVEPMPQPAVPATRLLASGSFIPSDVLAHIRDFGSVDQQRSAQTTMDVSPRGPAVEGSDGAGRPAAPTLQRRVYDANGQTTDTEFTVARQEGDAPTGDPAVDETYDAMGATYAFLWDAFGRDFHDDVGRPIAAVVHFGKEIDNSFWDGGRLVVGDGDGRLFNRFSASLDVLAHELCHALVEREVGLLFVGQSGALNESICDVLGLLVKQHSLRQRADEADWLLGAGLFTADVAGKALRSLAAPGTAYDDPVLGKDPQVRHMDDFVQTTADNGGVHINCGIPSHAFYRAATALGGFAWERAGLIWYEALRDGRLRPESGFSVFAGITVATAERRYGEQSSEVGAVADGWKAVGVAIDAPEPTSASARP